MTRERRRVKRERLRLATETFKYLLKIKKEIKKVIEQTPMKIHVPKDYI